MDGPLTLLTLRFVACVWARDRVDLVIVESDVYVSTVFSCESATSMDVGGVYEVLLDATRPDLAPRLPETRALGREPRPLPMRGVVCLASC